MNTRGEDLKNAIASLALFSEVRLDPAIVSLATFLDEDEGETSSQLEDLSDFAEELYVMGGDLSKYIRAIVMNDENPYLIARAKSQPVSKAMEQELSNELAALIRIMKFTPDDARKIMGYQGAVPVWENSDIDLAGEYQEMIDNIPDKGYGIFAKYYAFTIKDGDLSPVKHADPQTLETLYGYETERKKVYDNTKALADGKHAANVLLYGDAGTGKSSTIKACVNALKDHGVRLVEFDKDQISDIPAIIDKVYDTPLKFIFYIDDLSFTGEDDDFCYLKGVLEGNITGKSDNIVIYATSNRRHLVRELSEDRLGTDIHVNDTLQQQASLSARFGLTVTFQKPAKDLYLEIVKHLAEDEGIDVPEEELFRQAERFAIRSNGRSPRAAKQFLQLLKIGAEI